ncbi:bacillithiol biosynthesis deacetylase BshB2 [Deinococcus irradiatisoli]|uniref:Bacillithiol biosynthesis deacetylase BshB2 n=1 Tax=Deinococcus irradiatisoli TaxID=2202254 RepID=A0A2Z3JDR1_9DEIO|nr:bacillithiol biosynthesis deacetylase BshB2 [Deinococcus irradiatisoli]AWN23307.1 bacillithiol biosynthesis deacetylase BshB2 [Deinococcus irradiatisoli]
MSTRPILVVFPHPDDETLALGSLLARYAAEGVPITYLCATRGGAGRNMGLPLQATRETLPLVREQELRSACQALGIKDLRLLGFQDRLLEFEDLEDLVRPITQALETLQPSRVYTYYPEHGYHPDHDTLSRAVVVAMQRLPEEQRPQLFGTVFSEAALAALGEPDLTVPTAEYLPAHLAAVRAHRTQTAAMIAQTEARMAQDPDFRAQVEENRRTLNVKLWLYPFGTQGVRPSALPKDEQRSVS